MKIKFSSATLFLIGIVNLMAYLFYIGQLSGNIMIIMLFLMVFSIMFITRTKEPKGYWEIRKIAFDSILKLQKKGVVYDGTPYLTSETTFKNPFWEVAIAVDTSQWGYRGYLVRLDEFGKVLTTTQIDLPTEFRIEDYKREPFKEFKPKEEEEKKEEKEE